MSKRITQLQRSLYRWTQRELHKGTEEVEIIAALEIAKCNLAIAAAQVNMQLSKKPNGKQNN